MICVTTAGRGETQFCGITNLFRMKIISSILVPVDFSPVSANAFRYALRLADRLGASIDLLYCIPPTTENPGYGTFVNSLTANLEAEAGEGIREFLRQGLLQVAPDAEQMPAVTPYVRVGELRDQIRRHVEREDNQLIVMGTHGGKGNWEDVLGTNTSFLVAQSPCPLLVIPAAAKYSPLRNLCYATDLNHVDVFQADQLLRVLKPFNPALHFFHVRTGELEETEFSLGRLYAFFNRPGTSTISTCVSRAGDDITEAIFDYAEENHCDVLVMHRPEKTWFDRLFGKSSTKQATLRATLPLLIVRPTDLRGNGSVAENARKSSVDS